MRPLTAGEAGEAAPSPVASFSFSHFSLRAARPAVELADVPAPLAPPDGAEEEGTEVPPTVLLLLLTVRLTLKVAATPLTRDIFFFSPF